MIYSNEQRVTEITEISTFRHNVALAMIKSGKFNSLFMYLSLPAYFSVFIHKEDISQYLCLADRVIEFNIAKINVKKVFECT